jgi:26S proteasome regulatory subunit N8
MSMAIAAAPEQKVVVHPIVLLSVVDHYNRVAKDTKFRVVGCLLGDASKDQVKHEPSAAAVLFPSP